MRQDNLIHSRCCPDSSRYSMSARLRRIARHAGDGPREDAGELAQFETAFARQLGGGEAIAFDHGRTALYALLHSLGIGAGDEVIVCAYTCHTVPRTIGALGAASVFVDIDPTTLGTDPVAVQRAITPRTRAIIVQHTYGRPADVTAALSAAQPDGIPVIEDCCQSLGVRHGGVPIGTSGVAAFYSFQWNKPISAGQGGMAVVHDAELARRVRAFRNSKSRPLSRMARLVLAAQLAVYELVMFPRTAALFTQAFRLLSRALLMPGGTDAGHDATSRRAELESPAFMTSLQAALGRLEIMRYDHTAKHRRGVARALSATVGEAMPDEAIPLRLAVRVNDPLAVIAAAQRRGFELTTWFDVPLDPHQGFRPEPGYTVGSCPQAERAVRQMVLVPTGTRVTHGVVRRMQRFFRDQAHAILSSGVS